MLLRKKSDNFQVLHNNLIHAFGRVKEEFSEHLHAINENSNEIQANYEYLCELDSKINKLAERIEELTLFVHQPVSISEKPAGYDSVPLTEREREVFQALYAYANEVGHATYKEVARRCGLPETLVQSYVTNLIAKGVPIHKKYLNKEVLLFIEPGFCELQAKENVLKIDELISEKVISEKSH